jgi:hypothetical protein
VEVQNAVPGQSGYAVGWGTLALINAGLAQAKGRSGLAWFLISLVIGPIATLLIVLLPRQPESVQPLGPGERTALVLVAIVLVLLIVGLLAAGSGAVHVGPITL